MSKSAEDAIRVLPTPTMCPWCRTPVGGHLIEGEWHPTFRPASTPREEMTAWECSACGSITVVATPRWDEWGAEAADE